MKKSIIGAALSGAVLAATAGVAFADTTYNDLDGTADAVYEVINLTFDGVTGTTGSTDLVLRIDGPPTYDDRGGCNVNGGPHYITLTATSTDPSVADVTNGPDYVFNDCGVAQTVTVQAFGIGSADIEFEITDSELPPGAPSTFSTVEANFTVNVTGGSEPPTGCDADPAAPAWANAILKANGFKSGAKQTTNLVSTIAKEMGNGATFAGIDKAVHPDYETAVELRLEQLTGKSLVPGTRPGWECAPTS